MIFINNNISNNDRRILTDWDVNINCKSIKLINIYSNSTVGDHYHKDKDELFILINGEISELKVGDFKKTNVTSPSAWIVKRGCYHKFTNLNPVTLMCLSTETFNKNDDFK